MQLKRRMKLVAINNPTNVIVLDKKTNNGWQCRRIGSKRTHHLTDWLLNKIFKPLKKGKKCR